MIFVNLLLFLNTRIEFAIFSRPYMSRGRTMYSFNCFLLISLRESFLLPPYWQNCIA